MEETDDFTRKETKGADIAADSKDNHQLYSAVRKPSSSSPGGRTDNSESVVPGKSLKNHYIILSSKIVN